jgi:hypothetical protein
MSNSAYVIIKQNECMRKFRNAEATGPKQAKTLEELGVKPDRIFRGLEDKAVFLPGRDPGTYYMDANAADDLIAARRRRALLMMVLGLAAALALFLLARR